MNSELLKETGYHSYCFGDNLMATHFSLHIEATAGKYRRLQGVAEEYFSELHRLESLLSRFIEDSDISRINRLQAGETAVISPETFQCLQIAAAVTQQTDGHFDVAYRSGGSFTGMKSAWVLLTHPHRVTVGSGTDIDLGGIGKGFALDHGSKILRKYGYERALLCASTSTILALQQPRCSEGWAVMLDLPFGQQTVKLADEAVGCSGTSVRGNHIFDVSSRSYQTNCSRVWVRAATAALADALSTAATTMSSVQFRGLGN